MRVGKKAVGVVAEGAAGMVVPPPLRFWQGENDSRRNDAVGTGKGFGETVSWAADLNQNIQNFRGAGGNSWTNPNFVGKAFGAGPKVKIGLNMAAGAAIGMGSDILGEAGGDIMDAKAKEKMADLEAARFHGDFELADRIMAAINFDKTLASDSRTMGDAVSKGSNLGYKGAAVGAGAGLTVNLFRHMMGGEKHMEGSGTFMKDYESKIMDGIEKTFSDTTPPMIRKKSNFNPDTALDVLLERATRANNLEISRERGVIPPKIMNAIKKHYERFPDEDFKKKVQKIQRLAKGIEYEEGPNDYLPSDMTEENYRNRLEQTKNFPDLTSLGKRYPVPETYTPTENIYGQ